MPEPQPPRTLLSYARADIVFARQLRERLITEGLDPPWHDQTHMSAGEWWDQIEAVLTSPACEHVILVLSPAALAQDRHLVVKREWKLARREGKTVLPVIAPGGLTGSDRALMPGWMNATHAFDFEGADAESQWANFIAELKKSERQPRRPFMPPAMPEGFVARPEEFAKLKSALLDANGNAVAITAALRGAGGFGKTVLAQALAHDDDIQDAFHDGVLWVTLGEKPSLIEKLADLLKTLTGEPQGFTEVSAAANKLREVLAERKCLLFIDDVWSEGHLRPFTDGAPLTARLVTTRRDDILPKNALRVPVDGMKEAEAVELLSQGLGAIGPAEQAALRTLATERLGEWPVIIRLVNGFLRKEVERGATPRDAIQQANDRLDRKKLTVFDRNDETAREAAVESTIRASIDYLVEEIGKGQDPQVYNGQRYDELAVFPEDVEVPIATIARLWGRVAEVDAIDARDLLKHLYSLALLQALDLKRGTVRLHDVMRKYLTQKQAGAALKGLHHQFVDAYDAASGPDIEDAEERRYFYTWFPTHLHEAGEREVLDELLLDPQWMQRKLDALKGPMPLVSDFDKLAADRPAIYSLIGRTLRLTSGILTRDQRQLLPQLHGRLMGCQTSGAINFVSTVRRNVLRPAIITQHPSLTPPGAEIARLEGHLSSVIAVLVLPEGRLVSSSSGKTDNALRIWDLDSGIEMAQLKGHSDQVGALAVLPNGRLASGSRDRTIRIWDLASLSEVACLRGHDDSVTSLAVLPSHQIASGSWDRTIRIWDLPKGETSSVLEGHDHPITALAAMDNRLVSGETFYEGNTISRHRQTALRIWDTATLSQVGTISNPTGATDEIIRVSNRQLVARNAQGIEIGIVDIDAGTFEQVVASELNESGYAIGVGSLAILPDGSFITGGNNIRIFDADTKKYSVLNFSLPHPPQAIASIMDNLVAIANGSSISLVNLQNTFAAPKSTAAHARTINALCPLSDGRVVSGSWDFTCKVWDAVNFACVTTFVGHSDSVNALCEGPDGTVYSGSHDKFILAWTSSAARLVKHHHEPEVPGDLGVELLAILPDGRLAFVCYGAIGLLDWESKMEPRFLSDGPRNTSARSLLQLSDGRLASGTSNNDILIWDTISGVCIDRLIGHQGSVVALALLPDGRLASGSDDKTIRIWDTATGCETARLHGHTGSVVALASLSNGRLASASSDRLIRVWDTNTRQNIVSLELDHAVRCLCALPDGRVAVGDAIGRLHWLEIVE